MEGLRVSKLEEGQQWGKNTSSRDEVEWGRRPPYIVGEQSNRYPHFSPAESGTTAWPAVLPLAPISGTTAPPRGTAAGPRAVLPRWQGGTTAYERYYGPPLPRLVL